VIVGSVSEIRRTANTLHGPLRPPVWSFENDRKGFTYRGSAKDTGWPIKDALQIDYREEARGIVCSPVSCWKSTAMPVLEIDAAFRVDSTNVPSKVIVQVVPFSGERLSYPLTVQPDGTRKSYSIRLASKPEYAGSMKQILILLPNAKGSVRLYKIQGALAEKCQ
jgi:hypothetical protein